MKKCLFSYPIKNRKKRDNYIKSVPPWTYCSRGGTLPNQFSLKAMENHSMNEIKILFVVDTVDTEVNVCAANRILRVDGDDIAAFLQGLQRIGHCVKIVVIDVVVMEFGDFHTIQIDFRVFIIEDAETELLKGGGIAVELERATEPDIVRLPAGADARGFVVMGDASIAEAGLACLP